jgi:hypothetical protein
MNILYMASPLHFYLSSSVYRHVNPLFSCTLRYLRNYTTLANRRLMLCSAQTALVLSEKRLNVVAKRKNASLEPILAPERGARSDTIEVLFRDKIIHNYYEFS